MRIVSLQPRALNNNPRLRPLELCHDIAGRNVGNLVAIAAVGGEAFSGPAVLAFLFGQIGQCTICPLTPRAADTGPIWSMI